MLYQVSPPVTLIHTPCAPTLPLTLSHSNDVLYQGDCDAGVRELAAALGWQHELERLCSQRRGQYTVLHHGAVTK